MKIFSVEQIRRWDKVTIENRAVTSVDLMEIAAKACVEWIEKHFGAANSYIIFCGPGNNGGDGLAIARLLKVQGYSVEVYTLTRNKGSAEYEENKKRWQEYGQIEAVQDPFPALGNAIVIDAIFGSGLSRKPDGIYKDFIEYLNEQSNQIVSIDIPSGMYADKSSAGNTIIKSDHVLSFQHYKLAFLLPENYRYTGEVHLLDIRLSREFSETEASDFELTDKEAVLKIYQKRKPFSHKGTYGSAAIFAGCFGMMGAAVLSAKACLRTGVGKLTTHVPETGYDIIQISAPEAMVKVSGHKHLAELGDLSAYNAIGIGPGMGQHDSNAHLLKHLFEFYRKPLVIDADGLNTIAAAPDLLELLPADSILTPHPGEFERLFGKSESDFDAIRKALHHAKQYRIHIVLKGHYTLIASKEGKGYFNPTGNAGMATGGAGDVLTGILTALLAQRYTPLNAAILGVYLHGLAGDIAASRLSQEAMIAGDIIESLPQAFATLNIRLEK